MLPTRETGPLAAWLILHPGLDIISRDRAGAYTEGTRRGAPDALQIADRSHLRQGLGRAAETCVVAHRELVPVQSLAQRHAARGHPTGFRAAAARPSTRRPAGRAQAGRTHPAPRAP
ncbi:hypothetical protein GCM10010425_81160 [Streptomyces spororaveus]|uniref:Transposase n=1 Tax=Streptomyces spororaveus TaxID=284039 RepID=A0ABQ3T3B1_9ACTN|nr:hypothetical protein Sspor_04420 [Streptomyces spororaveus]